MDTIIKATSTISETIPEGRGGMIIKALISIALVLLIVGASKKIFYTYNKWKKSKPWILKGTKNAKKRMIILQDPSKDSAITIGRSENQEGGIEFSYVFWMFIDDWAVKYGQWKHVMHKGNDSSWPLRAPGVWLHPTENIIRVYMNSFKKIDEYIEISNIPIHKWFHMAICLREKNLDVFFNGNLVKRKVLEGLPKQNYGDVYVNNFNGFSGYLSRFKYYNYYISYSEILNHLNRGPSMMPCVDSAEMPPYLAPNWWVDN